MKKIWLCPFLVSSFYITSCKVSDKSKATSNQPEAVIETIGGKSVTTSDFKYVYNKNNSNSPDAYTDKSVRDYLLLYTNFRLKVQEGEKLALDTSQSFKNELNGYKKQLAQPYLKEKEVTDRLVKEAYDRSKEEVKASHILIKLAEDAEPKDTLIAYNEIISIRKKAIAGEDFGQLAKQYSQDPSAQTNKGDLGYFTALQMVYPFENAAFTTKPGDISFPVRTRFGYHILKVYDKRASQGQVKVAHIMVRYNEGGSEEDSSAARNRVNEIATKLNQGESWDLLCAQFSEDTRTKGNKGELDWFGTNQMFPAFEEASFKLKNKGDITSAVQTPYGFHLIKLIDKKGLEPFEKMEAQLKTKVSKDSRSEVNQLALLDRLKKENKLVENKKSYDWALTKADSNLTTGKWDFNANDKELGNSLFTINNKKYTVGDFFTYLKSNQSARRGHTPGFAMSSLYKTYLNASLISYEEEHLSEKYNDYKMLVKEYRDGILLFQLMEDNVWTKAITDTVGLKKYFSENRDKYKWTERADVVIYNAASQQILDETKAYLKQNLYPVQDIKVESIKFNSKATTLAETETKQLDQLAIALAKDKHLYAQLNIETPKTEKVAVSKKRLAEVKTYLKNKGADTTRLTLNTLAGPAALKEPLATFKFYSNSKKALEKLLNKGNALNLQITEGKFEKNANEFLNQTEWKTGESTVDFNGRKVFIIVKNIETPRNKEFEETRGQVISDYQNYLEKTWIEKLRKENPVVVNDDQVKSLIKQQ